MSKFAKLFILILIVIVFLFIVYFYTDIYTGIYTKDEYVLFQVTIYNPITESYDSTKLNEVQKCTLLRHLNHRGNDYEVRNGDIYVNSLADSPEIMFKYTRDFGLITVQRCS